MRRNTDSRIMALVVRIAVLTTDREKRELKSSLFLRFHRGVLRHPPYACFVLCDAFYGGTPYRRGI